MIFITVTGQIEKKIQIIVEKSISKLVMTGIHTCTSPQREKIRLACIDAAELRGGKANPVQAKEARDYLNSLIGGKDVDKENYEG